MRSHLLSITIIFTWLLHATSASSAEESALSRGRVKQLVKAYGFVVGQNESLNAIAQAFPGLSAQANASRILFEHSVFGSATDSIESQLQETFKSDWIGLKEKMIEGLRKANEGQVFSNETSITFLSEVIRRSEGAIPDEIRQTFLANYPNYLKTPELEIFDGWKAQFNSRGHEKSKDLDFSVSFPGSWSRREGNRPNMIQVFHSEAGHGEVVCTLSVHQFDGGELVTDQEAREFFQEGGMKDLFPEGARNLRSEAIVLDGSPADLTIGDMTLQRVDFKVDARTVNFSTIWGNHILFIQFIISPRIDSNQSLDDVEKKYIRLLKGIAATTILNSKYK